MRIVLTVGLVLLVVTQASAETRFCITSRYQGNVYESCATEEQWNKVPPWAPFGKAPPPVSAEKALQLARLTLEKHVPESERSDWTLTAVNLQHLHDYTGPTKEYAKMREEKWYYVVHFWNQTNPVVELYPTPRAIEEKQQEFNIVVLMSGEVCDPVLRKK